MAKSFVQELGEEFRSFILNSGLPSVDNVPAFAAQVVESLQRMGVKRATVFGFGAGGSVAQAIAILQPKFVRRLVLLDSTTRLRPNLVKRIVDKLENFLPLGLPFGRLSSEFDSRPNLHRIFCPTLVICSSEAGSYVRQQGRLLVNRIPNAAKTILPVYQTNLTAFNAHLHHHLTTFLQVPTKNPQKQI